MFTVYKHTITGISLLSREEAKQIPEWVLACGRYWWLRSPGDGYDSDHTSYVSSGGSVSSNGFPGFPVNFFNCAVRPALKISLVPRVLELGETVKILGRTALYVGDDMLLLAEPIGKRRFDAESNVYETSEIKQWIEKWLEKEMENGYYK